MSSICFGTSSLEIIFTLGFLEAPDIAELAGSGGSAAKWQTDERPQVSPADLWTYRDVDGLRASAVLFRVGV